MMELRKKESKRAGRVASELRQVLMDIFLRGELHDPELAHLWISEVRFTPDLRCAYVYVRGDSEVSAEASSQIESKLNRARGFLRRRLAGRLRLRYMPDLKFFWDHELEKARNLHDLLGELNREDQGG
jgi:ribosome-binding factor A